VQLRKRARKSWARSTGSIGFAVALLFPGRAEKQGRDRWNHVLGPQIGTVSGRKGGWTIDEDSKLKGAVHTRGTNDWVAVAMLVPGRTNCQCRNRWNDVLKHGIDCASGRVGSWTVDKDSKL
jgi:myb proto-oncogene protein